MNIKQLVMPVAVIAATAFFTSCENAPKVSYNTASVERQDISTSITATGTIEPVTEVEVGTQVSGIIDKIYVDYNSTVHKGDIIAELDKTNLLSELASAQSNLINAKSSLDYQTSNFNRYKTLYDKGLVSADDYENARLLYIQAKEQYAIQQQNVAKAQTNLGYATITAPIDGVVLSKEVEEGQTVASSMTTPTLFIIAQDLTDMRVIADVDEADIGGVVEGQRVTFTVDAYPDDIFEGNVTQVRQEATTESNVVTYEVVISAQNDDLKLKPGLTANVTIYTNEKKGVLSVPSKALKFTPNENLLSKDETIADCEGKSKVWVKEGNEFKAIAVSTGTTNGILTEIKSGVKEGDKVITEFSMTGMGDEEEQQGNNNPFMPGPPNKNKKK
ncbi:MAG: efflux RND transporter periplasmic adaptor subunit [Bacteroides sp.]|nr:efflux RND transporter periplasmic adaptor subunit [Roseburia sp.]MCM1345571.1 efflux RND transporter periplasmic adaptor subunit [Bacteroides sp.]MCM1420771.1 efflux RND transporter periplasmic adaptor subunit [Bacteroides sp.]